MYMRRGRDGRLARRPDPDIEPPPGYAMLSRRARIAILVVRYAMAAVIATEGVLLRQVTSSWIRPGESPDAWSLDSVLLFLFVFVMFALAPTVVLLGANDPYDAALAWRRLARATVPLTIVAVGLAVLIAIG
jgi:hypothetical protein